MQALKNIIRTHWGKLLFLGLLVSFSACNSLNHQGSTLQRQLLYQIQQADKLTHEIQQSIENQSFDSVFVFCEQRNDILFYLFDEDMRMIYWSNNWLTGSYVDLYRDNEWFYQLFYNAHTICRWLKHEKYAILTIIPIRYNYNFENKQLKNTFIEPFDISADFDITHTQQEEFYPIYDAQRRFLFSLCNAKKIEQSTSPTDNFYNSFSYHTLSNSSDDNDKLFSILSSRKFYLFSFSALVFFYLLCIFIFVYTRGMRNMKIANKILYLIFIVIVSSYTIIFFVSVQHLKTHYEKQQRENLLSKSKFIQSALQNLYYWNIQLTDQNTHGLNTDLKDLSYYYQTDIHVYDMEGDLVGTSIPSIFDNGILSKHIAPTVYFHDSLHTCQTEQIGTLSYLTTYTEFYNGNFVQIGYISLPFFISEDEMTYEVDSFLSHLLPSYIFIFMLAIFLAYLIVYRITSPMTALTRQMAQFQVGKENQHTIDYRQNDELGLLVQEYNNMVEQLEKSTQLLAQSEREVAWRTMARQIAHEINNSLTPMKLTIQQLQRMRNSEKFNDYFQKTTQTLIEQINSLNKIASSFSSFAKLPQLTITTVNVAQKLSLVINLMKNNADQIPIRYIGPSDGVFARTDEQQISQVFTNLITNALQAIGDNANGNIIVILKNDTEKRIQISISDNGCGIPEEIQPKIFFPNFTTKTTGMGLGLAISKNIVEGGGGSITFETSPQGTTFYITLLAAEPV